MSRPPLALQVPVLLAKRHDLAGFASGEQTLDDWLRQRALANLENGASRSYVVCPAGDDRVVGYYALAMGQVLNREVPGNIRRNMPVKIPAVTLGRLAVDRTAQGQGLGGALLQDAVVRSLRAAEVVAARLMIVHAISPAAETFCLHHGFRRISGDAPALALDLVKVKAFSSG
jgi:GNAT superfamily N-acetyltransferase